jgi:hypothetical protein
MARLRPDRTGPTLSYRLSRQSDVFAQGDDRCHNLIGIVGYQTDQLAGGS